MKPPILLVHPDRYKQILESAGSLVHPASPSGIDYRQFVGIEVRQSSYVPLTTTIKQRRPWWAVWRPEVSQTEQPILGWWFTEHGTGNLITELPRSFAVRKEW
jgi:hypothetical protein